MQYTNKLKALVVHMFSGLYMYIETSHPRKNGDKAKIEKGGLRFSGNTCIRFFYHMFGRDIDTLKVLVAGKNVFELKGAKGNMWKEANVKVPLNGIYPVSIHL